MMSAKNIDLTPYAIGRFVERSRLLGRETDETDLRNLLATARPEQRSKRRSTRLHFLKRNILRGKARYLVAAGWRFVVSRQWSLITVERIKPHENYVHGERRNDGGQGKEAA